MCDSKTGMILKFTKILENWSHTFIMHYVMVELTREKTKPQNAQNFPENSYNLLLPLLYSFLPQLQLYIQNECNNNSTI